MGSFVNSSKSTIKIDATKFHQKLKNAPIKQTELARELGVCDAYFANCKRDNVINPLVFHYVCQKFGWDEKEFEFRTVPVESVATDENQLDTLIRTLNSINSTMLELNRRVGTICDKLSTIDGKASNINLGISNVEFKLATLIKELTGK